MNTPTVHHVLIKSYLTFLYGLIPGIFLDIVYPRVFSFVYGEYIGFALLSIGTFIIFWAQRTTRRFAKARYEETLSSELFARGPYRFSRNPTHVGLGIVLCGVAFILQAVFLLISITIVYIITRHAFISKEEKLLEDKYGEAYRIYKKTVRKH